MAEGEERPSGGGDDEDGEYPIGFRFKPTTEELVEFYLLPRLLDDEPILLHEFAIEANAYGCDPEILTEKYKDSGVDDTWHFLSPRYRKYPGGDRPVRRTADDRGRWKPSTGKSKEEDASTSHSKAKKAFAFSENTLAYFVGSKKDETKTKWLMHELVVPETGFHFRSKSAAEPGDDMLLNRYVVCTIYKSPLKKWKEIDEEEEAAAEVPTSSQSSSSGPAPECVGEAAARAPSSRQPPAKRPAVERPVARGQTGAPNKRVSQTTLFPGGGRSAPATRGIGGGSSVRMPARAGAGAGAAGHYGPPGLPALVHWPPVYNNMQGPVQQVRQPPLVYGYGNRAAGKPNANGQAAPGQGPPPVYNNMQGPVQVQQPPLVYGYGDRAAGTPNANGQAAAAPGQGPPPVLRLRPTHRAAATAPSSLGPKMMMRPRNLAAGQPARLPSPRQQQQQQPPPETDDEAYRNHVYARMVAEIKLQRAQAQQGSAARAGQQRIEQTASASAQPACSHDEGGNRPAGVEVMVPPAQFPAPYPYPYSSSSSSSKLAQRPQRQQSFSVTQAAVETPEDENVPSKQSVPQGGNEGSGKGDAATIADDIILQILTGNLPR